MKIQKLIDVLESECSFGIDISFPNGDYIPPHFHITEIGKVYKTFIDCGGTRREHTSCILQVWTANDFDHRITAGKLAKILRSSLEFIEPDLPVEIEYGPDVASTYYLKEVSQQGRIPAFVFTMDPKKTDCLAKEQCGLHICNNDGCC
jgi:hypothetical protein